MASNVTLLKGPFSRTPSRALCFCRPRKLAMPRQSRHYAALASISRQSRLSPRIALGLLLGGAIVYFATASPSSQPQTLNDQTFVPYSITARTELSPSSFVITVLPHTPNPSPPYFLPGTNRWRHPLWSVEFKQPQVQIARHYTPLPPPPPLASDTTSSSSAAIADDAGALSFYIRAIGDGEMSNYLNRLRVGQDVFLRGPHVGFDIVRRLGAQKAVVFLAGGTGVVPAMQAVRVTLDAYDDAHVGLLWAVRSRDEIQARDSVHAHGPSGHESSWWNFRAPTTEPMELSPGIQTPSPIAKQLADMKSAYGDRFTVHVVVDQERSVFRKSHIEKALTVLSNGASPHDNFDCYIHSQRKHELMSEFETDSPSCTCLPADGALPGKNLFIVSGPDGFVSHYAGPKIWRGGKQTQGPVGGVVAEIQKSHPQIAKDWLVLKL